MYVQLAKQKSVSEVSKHHLTSGTKQADAFVEFQTNMCSETDLFIYFFTFLDK